MSKTSEYWYLSFTSMPRLRLTYILGETAPAMFAFLSLYAPLPVTNMHPPPCPSLHH